MRREPKAFSITLNPETPQARTVLNVPNYNFHEQKAYNLGSPIPVKAGDRIQVTCTYDPTLAEELPILRRAPAHFVTFGDGSSDEMCVWPGVDHILTTQPAQRSDPPLGSPVADRSNRLDTL